MSDQFQSEGGADVRSESAGPGHPVLHELAQHFADLAWVTSHDQQVVLVPRERLREVAERAREAGFEMCVDVTAVDYLHRGPRFEVVTVLVSQQHQLRLRLRTEVPGDDPTVPSLVPVYPGANYFEREVYDMFGITFADHPDLTRILMPDDWEGHPLRKDYPVGGVPVQFKDAHRMT